MTKRNDDGEAMMEGMAHGIDAYNEAIGSPLGGGAYCDDCGLERGAGHHCCRCEDGVDDEDDGYRGEEDWHAPEVGHWGE